VVVVVRAMLGGRGLNSELLHDRYSTRSRTCSIFRLAQTALHPFPCTGESKWLG
jgi:hypothetical protein